MDGAKKGKAGAGTMAKMAEVTDQLGKHLNDALLEFRGVQDRLDRCDADITGLKLRLNAKDGAMDRLEHIVEVDRSKIEMVERNLKDEMDQRERATDMILDRLKDQISEAERSTKSNAW